jgi:trk system potassium uptake protein TrkA
LKIIIVGAGEVGFHIARHLAHENKDVVVIDKNTDALRRVSENIDVQIVQGSGASPVVLEEAGLQSTEILLAVTNSDETNLIASLVANMLSPSTRKLARIRDGDFDRYHDHFREQAPHIDTVINPEIEVVKTIERLMQVPGAVDVAEFADGQIKFIGVHLDAASRLVGVQLSDLPEILGENRPLLAALVRDDELIIPRGKDYLRAGDLVYFIAEHDRLQEVLTVFDKHPEPLKRVMIVGGGRIGYRLASLLDQQQLQTKIIESDPDRCNLLAEKLDKVVVLCGDGSDRNLLQEENIGDIDVIISVTHDDETNILTSLLARRLGARKAITKISKFSYLSLMAAIGIEQVVSPRLSAVSSILKFIRRGKVISAISIKGEQAEVMEAVAMETSDIVGKPLKKISFPKGSLLVGIVRSEKVIIPSGESVVEPGDRVIIFSVREAIPGIEKILSVKLEYF